MLSSSGRSMMLKTSKQGSCVAATRMEFFASRRFISKCSETQKPEYLTKPSLIATKPDNRMSRFLSTSHHPFKSNYTTVAKSDHHDFISVFPDLLVELSEKTKYIGSPEAAKRFARSLQYNVPKGKLARGLSTVLAFKAFAKPETITSHSLQLAHYLGWCVEMLHSSLLITDDIMDESETRRGLPCWYKLEDVKLEALNDALMMENGIFIILKNYFSHTSYYVKLLELFHDALFITSIGQLLDLQSPQRSVDDFTMERYNIIVLNKSTFYSFYFPIALAMHMSGNADPEALEQTKKLATKIVNFFQIQDDFLDCFGDPKLTGKVGTDIQDGKCTWLSVVCMQRANEGQKNIMRKNYGRNEPDKVATIKNLYKDLELPKAFAELEEDFYKSNRPTSGIETKIYDILDPFCVKADKFITKKY